MALIDMVGKRFGRLVVLERSENNGNKVMWRCKCDCGKIVDVFGTYLRTGDTKSCGCYASDARKNRATKHNMCKSRLYRIWHSMKIRCYNPKNKRYHCYGGKGVSVCEEWKNDFSEFMKWAYENGYDENAPKWECTIDRIDSNGNYCPENCRWATIKEQNNNRTNNTIIFYNGCKKTISQWSEELGIEQDTISARLKRRPDNLDLVFYKGDLRSIIKKQKKEK